MKYRRYYTSKKKRGFTIIESLVYIFLTTMILVEGLNLYVLMYKHYIETRNLTIEYNNFQNFYITLDSIILEGGLKDIIVDDKSILLIKTFESQMPNKVIKSYNEKIIVDYIEAGVNQPPNTMLRDIDNLEVKRKGKLIYFTIHDKDGKEFIRCI